MLDPKEIDIEIARLEYGESSYPAYAKLATLYTIKNQMNRAETKQQEPREPRQAYSLAAAPESAYTGRYGDSEFLREIEGRDQESVFAIIDDLIDTLRVTNPRVYNGVLRKIRAL